MGLSYRARRGLSLVVLLIFMPLYIVVCVSVVALLGDLPVYFSLPLYIVMGVGWVLPFRRVFLGVGKADPDDEAGAESGDTAQK